MFLIHDMFNHIYSYLLFLPKNDPRILRGKKMINHAHIFTRTRTFFFLPRGKKKKQGSYAL